MSLGGAQKLGQKVGGMFGAPNLGGKTLFTGGQSVNPAGGGTLDTALPNTVQTTGQKLEALPGQFVSALLSPAQPGAAAPQGSALARQLGISPDQLKAAIRKQIGIG
jgi:hypothetical protein